MHSPVKVKVKDKDKLPEEGQKKDNGSDQMKVYLEMACSMVLRAKAKDKLVLSRDKVSYWVLPRFERWIGAN